MYLCIYVSIYVSMYLYIYVYMYIVYMYLCIYVSMYVCIYVCIYMYLCMFVFMYVSMYLCVVVVVVFLTLTDPLRIQPWSQDRRNQTKSNRESQISMESRPKRTDKKVANKGHRRDKIENINKNAQTVYACIYVCIHASMCLCVLPP